MDEQEQREREEDARLIANASRAPWRSSADCATDEDLVDLVADARGDVVAKLWPNAGCFEAFERSKADGRFIARARSRFPAVIAQRDAAEARVKELEARIEAGGNE